MNPITVCQQNLMFGKLNILTDTLHEDTHALVTHFDYNLIKPNKII